MRRFGLRVIERGEAWLPAGNRPALWVAIGVAFVAALALTALMLVDLQRPPDLLLFVGRFHPMIVHFPIGLILLAGMLELFAAVHRPFRVLRYSTAVVLFLGSVSAVGAAIAGYLLSLEGGYDPGLVQTHMWLGLAVAIGASLATVLKLRSHRRQPRSLDRIYAVVVAATIATLMVAGHVGGSLTHGSGYLTHYLPEPLRTFLAPSEARAGTRRIADIDSAFVYQDLIVPIFEARCTSCHNASKEKGRLRLDTREGLLKGGDNGTIVVAGLPEESPLLQRVTLAPGTDKAMPPDGAPPLDVGETELIRWWIANGASFEQRVGDVEEIPTAVSTLLLRLAPPRPEKKRGVYALTAASADPKAVAAVRRMGFRVQEVAADLSLLHVTAVNIRAGVGDAELDALLPIAPQITWLDLGGTRVGDAGIAVVARMPNLTRLFLEGTAVGDEGLRHLKGLRHLEYLNLHDTRVSDAGIEHLAGLEGLQSVYLWQTDVSPEGVRRLKQARGQLDVVLGAQLPAPDSIPSAPARPAG